MRGPARPRYLTELTATPAPTSKPSNKPTEEPGEPAPAVSTHVDLANAPVNPDEILHLIEELEDLGDVAWEHYNLHVPLAILHELAEVYPTEHMSPAQRDAVYRICKPRLQRMRTFQDSQQRYCFDRIMELKTRAELEAALSITPETYQRWTPDPGEDIYMDLGGWIGKHLELTKHSSVPVAFHFWAAVFALGAAARRNIYFKGAGVNHAHYLNWYMFFIAPQSGGKSHAMSMAKKILRKANESMTHYSWNELVQQFSKVERDDLRINFIPEDCTTEGVIDMLMNINNIPAYYTRTRKEEKPQVLPKSRGRTPAVACLMLDEISSHFGKGAFNIDSKAPFYTKVRFDDYYDKGLKTEDPVEIHELCLSMLGCSAPAWLKDTITHSIMNGGFIDRTLIVNRDELSSRAYSLSEMPPVDPLMIAEQAKRLSKWMELERPQCARFSERATEFLVETYHTEMKRLRTRLRDMDEGDRQTSINRAELERYSLATILAMSDDSFPIVKLRHCELAYKFLLIEDFNYKDFLNVVSKSDSAQVYDAIYWKLYKEANNKVQGWVSRYDIARPMMHSTRQRIDSIKSASYIDTYLADLVEQGILETKTEQAGGKARARWRLSPELVAYRSLDEARARDDSDSQVETHDLESG